MDTQAGLLLAGGSGGGSGGDLHGSQAAAAAAALQVGSQPLPEQGTAAGQQLFAGTGTDNGEPAYLTLEVHSALARCAQVCILVPLWVCSANALETMQCRRYHNGQVYLWKWNP